MTAGFGKAIARLVDPFISESIWIQALQDLYARGGKTDTGSEVWNPRDPEGDKFAKGLKHLAEALAPLSLPQIGRLIKAGRFGEDPETGKDLSFTGEAAGFFGFRNQKMDFEQSLGFKISEYNTALRQSRKFLPRPTGNVKTQDIIEGLIQGNDSWYEAQKDMQKDIAAMKDLGFDDKKIGIIFDRRGLGRDYNSLIVDRFKPFDLPKGLIDAYIRNAQENGYDNPLTPEAFNQINEILRELNQLYLSDKYPQLMRETNISNMSALPPTPMPNIQPTAQQINPTTNLTRTEQALLSPEEQVIASRT
jgi:hypothetical protein